MNTNSILAKLDKIDNLPTLPAVAMEVNNLLQDPNIPVSKLSETIEKDHAMVLKLLKLVNSAFYGCPSKIGAISDAIVILGFSTVRNAIVSLSIIKSLAGSADLEGFDMTDFWKHSLSVAVTSKQLAQLTRIESPDSCFVGGLLHDIGKVILCQHFKDFFERVWDRIQKENLLFYEAEIKETHVTHSMIGCYLAKKWNLPSELVDAIECHHVLRDNVGSYNLLAIIHAADIIVNNYNPGSNAGLDMLMIHPDAVKLLKDPLENISNWHTDLTAAIESACNFFLEGS